MDPFTLKPKVGSPTIELLKTDDGKIVWFFDKVRSFELSDQEAAELGIALLGGTKLRRFQDVLREALDEAV